MANNSEFGTFSQVRARLDEIVVEVRDKDLSLEKSLDLYEEAIKLGNRCAELVDKSDYTKAEELAAREVLESQAPELTISGGSNEPAAGEPDAAHRSEAEAEDEPAASPARD